MKRVLEEFEKIYPDEKDVLTSFCPYRVCPLGAHSDHQLGVISGFAISYGVHIAFVPTEDGSVYLHSMNVEGDHSFSLSKIPAIRYDWADYLRGATIALRNIRELNYGMKAVIMGTMPSGGLSSSAALIISYLSALCRANGILLTQREMIDTALWAENRYVGVKCGKMDQSVEVLSEKDNLLFLDNRNDEYELIPQNKNAEPYEIAIFFSGVERTLVGSAFNARVDEMKSAAYALKAFSGMEYSTFSESYLRDVPRVVFDKYKHKLPENWYKRAEHFYTEFDRVQEGKKQWKAGNLERFGKLIFESGKSSIENYEAGSPELKKLYRIMCETDGIYGGRFSGAGFKGCCMAIIDPSFKQSIEEKVEREYLDEFPALRGKFATYFCTSADGCKLDEFTK